MRSLTFPKISSSLTRKCTRLSSSAAFIFAFSLLVCTGNSLRAAVIASWDGSQNLDTSSFTNLTQSTWRAPSGSTALFTASTYPAVYGGLFHNNYPDGTTFSMAFNGTAASDQFYISQGGTVAAGTILLAPMLRTTGFVGSLDSITYAERNSGTTLTYERRLTVQLEDGSYYISNASALTGGGTEMAGTFTPTTWFAWNPTVNPFTIGAASTFTGTGEIAAVGYWVTETSTGASAANHGITTITFNGTAIPEPGSALLLLLSLGGLTLRRRSRRA